MSHHMGVGNKVLSSVGAMVLLHLELYLYLLVLLFFSMFGSYSFKFEKQSLIFFCIFFVLLTFNDFYC